MLHCKPTAFGDISRLQNRSSEAIRRLERSRKSKMSLAACLITAVTYLAYTSGLPTILRNENDIGRAADTGHIGATRALKW